MNNDSLDKIFDKIKPDDLMKERILNNIENQIKEENYVKISNKNERNVLSMKIKKLLAIAASIFIVGGLAFYSNASKNVDEPSTSAPAESSPMPGDVYVPDPEFNNFDETKLNENVSNIDIRNHSNTSSFKVISDTDTINKISDIVKGYKTKEMSDEIYSQIGKSQSEGNSITLRFTLKDGTMMSSRVNLDLNIICINDEYRDISPDLASELKNELKDIADFNDLNKPAPE